MLMLLEHTEYFRWKVTSRPSASIASEHEAGEVTNALVAFVNIENCDVSSIKNADRAARVIDGIARSLGVENVVVYPFAHLSPNRPARPGEAAGVLSEMAKRLEILGEYRLLSVPFGCTKAREASVMGHDRAVLLRSIR